MKINTCLPLTKLATALALLIPFAAFADNAKKLEIFSWWTSGGEAAALDALFKVYKQNDPGVEIINATVAGGGGSAAGGAAPADPKQHKVRTVIASARFQNVIDLRLVFRVCRVVEHVQWKGIPVKMR